MIDERTKILNELANIARRLLDLALNFNCKGIPTPVLKTWLNIIKSVFSEFFAEVDDMSINKAADRYGVSVQTIRNKIDELKLTPPIAKEEPSTKMIPKDTIEALDKYYGKKD